MYGRGRRALPFAVLDVLELEPAPFAGLDPAVDAPAALALLLSASRNTGTSGEYTMRWE
jgi:hypothetical protein